MGNFYKSDALVGFYGDDLDPAEITQYLGVEPTVGVCKGEVWRTANGSEKVASTGSWRLNADTCVPADLDGQINRLLVGPTDDLTLWRELTAKYRAVVFCGLWLASYNDGINLAAETLALMSERGLLLDLDIYESKRAPEAP